MAGTDWLTLAVFIMALDDPDCLRLMHGEKKPERAKPKLQRIPAGRFNADGTLK